MSDTEDTWAKVEVIFAGTRDNGKDAAIAFYEVGKPDERIVFTTPKTVRAWRAEVIGGVYEFERNGPHFRLNRTFKRGSGDERVPTWRAEQEAGEVAAKARKLVEAERKKGKDSVTELLAPMRKRYHATDHYTRLALEVVLLNALRRG